MTTNATFIDAPGHSVYVRSSWLNDWTLEEHLRCDRMTFACGPHLSTCELTWVYGQVLHNDATDYVEEPRLDILELYVKVVVDGGPTWYGIITDEKDDVGGGMFEADLIQIPPERRFSTGVQKYTAHGLEFALDR